MSYQPVTVVAAVARAVAIQLVPQYGARVGAEVEVELYSGDGKTTPEQFTDWVAIGGLVVNIATLAYQVYKDRKKQGDKPTNETLARRIRVERRKHHDLTVTEEVIIEIVSAEIVQRADQIEAEN